MARVTSELPPRARDGVVGVSAEVHAASAIAGVAKNLLVNRIERMFASGKG
jgi:hypothetical protein